MKNNIWRVIVSSFAVIAGFETAIHWLLGSGSAPTLLAIYLAGDAGGKHFYAGVVDNVIPSILLGGVVGWVGYSRWSTRLLAIGVAGVAIFVAALVPLYKLLIGPKLFAIVWGSPINLFGVVTSHLYDLLTASIASGAFTYWSYVFRRDWMRGRVPH